MYNSESIYVGAVLCMSRLKPIDARKGVTPSHMKTLGLANRYCTLLYHVISESTVYGMAFVLCCLCVRL